MNKKKVCIPLMIVAFIIISISGCEKNNVGKAESNTLIDVVDTNENLSELKDDTIEIYYLNKDLDGFEQVEYQLRDENCVENANTVIQMMSGKLEAEKEIYKVVLGDNIKINELKMTEDDPYTLNIDFAQSYSQLPSAAETMCRCAVVKTLVQIPGIDRVSYTIEKIPFMNSDGLVIGAMNADTFLNSPEEAFGFQSEMTLYYASSDGKKLVEILQEVVTEDNMLPEQAALEMLLVAPEDGETISPLPKKLKIQRVQILNNVCYVDLSSDFMKESSLSSDEVMIYSMVNSIIGLGRAASVEFTINGEKVSQVHEFKNFDHAMTFNFNLCE